MGMYVYVYRYVYVYICVYECVRVSARARARAHMRVPVRICAYMYARHRSMYVYVRTLERTHARAVCMYDCIHV